MTRNPAGLKEKDFNDGSVLNFISIPIDKSSKNQNELQ